MINKYLLLGFCPLFHSKINPTKLYSIATGHLTHLHPHFTNSQVERPLEQINIYF